MLQTTSIIGYISQFSCDQFRSRFRIPAHVVEAVTLLSTNASEYESDLHEKKTSAIRVQASDDYLLLVGNHYEHKGLRETLAVLQERDDVPPLAILGWKVDEREGLQSYRAGELSPEFVRDLYAGARGVLFPSHYEGFGLPIMHALAHRKPVISRNLPSAREIKQRAVHGANIHLFNTTAEMVSYAVKKPSWIEKLASPPLPVVSWCDAADAWEKAIDRAHQDFRFDALCERLHILSAANGSDRALASTRELQLEIARLQSLTEAYRASRSWRLTAPARAIATFTRGWRERWVSSRSHQ
jgi:glycosyltransferase involved in cell wall biosynthesis